MSSHEITTSSHTGSSFRHGSPRDQCDLLDTDVEDATLTAVALPSTSPNILAPSAGLRRQAVDTTTHFNDTEMHDRDTLVDTAEPLAVAYDGVEAASKSEVTSSSILQIAGVSLVAEPRDVVDLTRGDTLLGNTLTTDEDTSFGNNSQGRLLSDLREGARVVGFRLNIAPNTTNSNSVSRVSDHGFGDEDPSDEQLQILHLRPLDFPSPISATQSVVLTLPERSFQRGFSSLTTSQTTTVNELPYLPRVSEFQLRQHQQRQQLLEQKMQLQRLQQMQQLQRHQLHQQMEKHAHLYEKHYQVDQLQLHANHPQLDQRIQLRERRDQLNQHVQLLHQKHQQPDQQVQLHHKHQQPDQQVQLHHKHQQPDQQVQLHHKHQQPDQQVQLHHKHQQPDQHVQLLHEYEQPDQHGKLQNKKLDQRVHFRERLQQPDQPVQLHQTQAQQQHQLTLQQGKQEQQKQGELQIQKHHKQQQQHQQEEAVVCRLCCAPPGGFLKNLHSKLKPNRGGLAVIEELAETKKASLPPAVEYHSHRPSRTEKRSRSSRGSRSRRLRLVTSAAPKETDNGPVATCDIEISLARSNSCNSTMEQTIGDFNQIDFNRKVKDDEAQSVIANCFRQASRETLNCLLRVFWLMLYYLAIWLAVALFTFILLRFVLLLTSDGSRYPYYIGLHSCCLHGAQITFRPGWKSDGAAEYNADVKSQRRAVIEQLQAAAQIEEQAGGKGQTRDCASLEDEDGSRKLRPEETHEMQLLKPCIGAADFAAKARSLLSRFPGRPVVLVQLLRRIGYLPARPGGIRIACRSEPPMPLVHASLSASGVGRELDTNATYGRVPSGFFPALSSRHWLPPVLVALPDAPDIWGKQRVRLLCRSTDGGDAEDAPERTIVLSLRRT